MRGFSKKRQEMGEKEWAEYQKSRNRAKYAKNKQNSIDRVTKSRRLKKQKLVEYKGGQCEKCGLKSPIMGIYDFHHINPNSKDFGLASKNMSLDACKKEVDKCMLVCRNCHAIIHNEIYNSSKL